MQEPRKILKKLGLSESEITVYLSLAAGRRSPRDIIKDTGEKRPTVYYALTSLERRGLVSKSGKESDQKIILEPLHKLEHLVEEKKHELETLTADIQILKTALETTAPTNDRPTVSFFEGVEAVKNAMMDTLYCRSKLICSVVPKENFAWQVGAEFVERYVGSRIDRKIQTRNLWEQRVDPTIYQNYYKGKSDVRILPEVMHGTFQTIVYLYDDKTLYVSSRANAYCVLITSKEHHDTMMAWFEGLWGASDVYEKTQP